MKICPDQVRRVYKSIFQKVPILCPDPEIAYFRVLSYQERIHEYKNLFGLINDGLHVDCAKMSTQVMGLEIAYSGALEYYELSHDHESIP